MNIEVPPEALLETAAGLETEAHKLQFWLVNNEHRFLVEPPGEDQVSKDMAARLNDSAYGEMGAVPAAYKAVHNLLAAAHQMRASAAAYGYTEHNTASHLAATDG